MKTEKNEKFRWKDLFTNKQYRSILVLIFYAVLFVFIIVLLRGPKEVTSGDGTSNHQVLDGYQLIYENNFAYHYTVILDDITLSYEGKKNGEKELFTVSNGNEIRDYYVSGNSTYEKTSSSYIEQMKPYFMFDFFDTRLIEALLKRSVEIDADEGLFAITNQNAYDVLNVTTQKVNNETNDITLAFRNSYITAITFDLSNYATLIGENYNRVMITLEYYDFSLIEEIDISL